MSFRHDGGLLVRGGKDGVAVIEGLHHIPDKVHELIGFGLTGETADLHDTTKSVDKNFTFYRCSPSTVTKLVTVERGLNLSPLWS